MEYLCCRSELCDGDAHHTIHVLDAQLSQSMSDHAETVVGAAVCMTAAAGSLTAVASICSCQLAAMCAEILWAIAVEKYICMQQKHELCVEWHDA